VIRSFAESVIIHVVIISAALTGAGGFLKGSEGDSPVNLQLSTAIVSKVPADIPLPPAEEVGVAPQDVPEIKQEAKPEPKPKPKPKQEIKPKAEAKPVQKDEVLMPVELAADDSGAVAEDVSDETSDVSDNTDSSANSDTDNMTAAYTPALANMPICTGDSCGGGGMEGSRAFSLRELDVKPKAIASAKPEYPRYAKQNRIEGSVTVSFIIDTNGYVIEPEITKSNPPNVFDKAALAAVKNWRFSPAKKGGEAVNAKININVNFALDEY
jgi:protein TonB